MSDIVKIFSQIGSIYANDAIKIKNKAFEYKAIKAYLFDIENKSIEPNLNLDKDDLIICRFGVGANSGNLFPNILFKTNELKKDSKKFIKSVLKSTENLLSKFSDEDINKDDKLLLLKSVDEDYFNNKIDEILNLQEDKDKKTPTYFCLAYKNKPISAYYKQIFIDHISSNEETKENGYDILTNKFGIGADANLAFCSSNELPPKMQWIKSQLLPLNSNSAKLVKMGYEVMDKNLSYNFYGLKMALIPIVLSDNSEFLKEILEILKSTQAEVSSQTKKDQVIEGIKKTEFFIHNGLEISAESQQGLPVINTILFYEKSNAAVNLHLSIDDVLPSFITYVGKQMNASRIKAFRDKDSGNKDNFIYLQKLFKDKLEIMSVLLARVKLDKDVIFKKIEQLIYYGTVNMDYAYAIGWDKYFNERLPDRSIDAIKRYIDLFNNIETTKEKIILQKEIKLEEKMDKKQKIDYLFDSSEFLKENSSLKSAYLIGMLSANLINWQFGVNQSGSSSYAKWLNNCGQINKDSLDRIWKKSEETVRKLCSISGQTNPISTIAYINDKLMPFLADSLADKSIVKSSYIALAFAMGGSDFNKYIKTKKEGE
ncbi:CRISPR/Cas system-associated protein Cas8, type I-B/HMARI [Campylobacter iguaniorum]|uniref:CRISPR/Cas system-associated protein Cas8, type I-B/HMARI n=1 Tax=Campylobacter iguaniorum TaxID=1244531 RepID=A0A076FF39_9BACT|nr:TM1802 family CRISPR-associated protein [Campylobacter iguaniorum]AII14449.1 CRISPR/Cas system-associated protein Cas8, type I-B/HMARI [Campylobacter iguaniorum]